MFSGKQQGKKIGPIPEEIIINSTEYNMREAQWPHGYCSHLQIKWSGFEPWPGTLLCVYGQDTSFSQCLSPPRCINGYRQIYTGGNPAMD